MASTVYIDINFRRLLGKICAKFSLPPPRYGTTVVAEGRLHSFVDVEVPRGSRFMEIITCWGWFFPDSEQSEEDAARIAIKRLRDELGFEVKDINYDEKISYKELYKRNCDEHTELRDEYEMLNLDFDLLKKTYNILIEEKKQIAAELKEIKDGIARCHALINHPNVGPMDVESTAEVAILGDVETTATTEEDPEAPPGYYKI
uniref:Uncharacterized protein n=1 Tax=Ananas comosus var. bracteatus TaxID=296719 RepID=A0A6V7P5C3_ANACO|nr:unnamed protein product [Ananas comosus var. bracteatus]CAD1829836.1 unnamed protein product [Ananas comosus var. bracteatus]